jgi:hypothetical protein
LKEKQIEEVSLKNWRGRRENRGEEKKERGKKSLLAPILRFNGHMRCLKMEEPLR